MSKRMECFTAYWNEEADKVTIKLTPEFKANPITVHYAFDCIIHELKELHKKNYKKAQKAGLDIHVGCDSWPHCDESPGGCNEYNKWFGEEKTNELKFLSEEELDEVSSEAINLLQEESKHFNEPISLYEYRMVVAIAVQDRIMEKSK